VITSSGSWTSWTLTVSLRPLRWCSSSAAPTRRSNHSQSFKNCLFLDLSRMPVRKRTLCTSFRGAWSVPLTPGLDWILLRLNPTRPDRLRRSAQSHSDAGLLFWRIPGALHYACAFVRSAVTDNRDSLFDSNLWRLNFWQSLKPLVAVQALLVLGSLSTNPCIWSDSAGSSEFGWNLPGASNRRFYLASDHRSGRSRTFSWPQWSFSLLPNFPAEKIGRWRL